MGRTKTDNHPVDVYIQFVRSLFDNAHMLVLCAGCHAGVSLMVYWRNGQPVFLVLAGALLGIGVWRYFSLRRFHRSGGEIRDAADATKWEREYILKGSLQGLLMGIFCFISIYVYSDSYAEIGALSVTLASLVTVVGRNYGSPRMVMIFAVTFVGPIAAALILRFDIPYVVLGLLINAVGGILVVYAFGIIGLVLRTDVGLWAAVTSNGPFLPGDIAKVVVATVVAKSVHRAYPGLIKA